MLQRVRHVYKIDYQAFRSHSSSHQLTAQNLKLLGSSLPPTEPTRDRRRPKLHSRIKAVNAVLAALEGGGGGGRRGGGGGV